MSAAWKSVGMASIAAGVMATVEAMADGKQNPKVIAIHAGTAAAMVVFSYLKQSPIAPSSPIFEHERVRGKTGGR